jgi:hypothetical protein
MDAAYLHNFKMFSLQIHVKCKITAVRDILLLEQGIHADEWLGCVCFLFN